MGMYTELVLGVELRNDCGKEVLDVLKYMTGEIDTIDIKFDHPLFKTDRWRYMLQCGSAYFDGQPDSKLCVENLGTHKYYYLNVRCNFKNYCNEIDLFLDWLSQHMKTQGFIGYHRYEEYDDPTLIYHDYGRIKYKHVEGGVYD